MQKLFAQIVKFVLVGGLSFIIDFILYVVFTRALGMPEMLAQILAFTLSLIFNYVMSMRYVFVSKDELKKHQEFIIFVILSVLGAGLNWALFYAMVYVLVINDLITKIVVAGVVMVFNFVTRKIFLEKKRT